jgi:hypothetical protein
MRRQRRWHAFFNNRSFKSNVGEKWSSSLCQRLFNDQSQAREFECEIVSSKGKESEERCTAVANDNVSDQRSERKGCKMPGSEGKLFGTAIDQC